MRYAKPLMFFLLTMSVIGCKAQKENNEITSPESASQASAGSEKTEASPTNENSLTEAQILEEKFTKGMSYQDIRNNALGEGWLPLRSADCRENVGGEALICGERPEVESCSGDGHCNMWFAHASSGSKLKVGTYADQVKFWEFSSAATDEKAMACPSQKFEDFLKAFASDKATQIAFTAPFVMVEELVDGNEKGFSERSVLVAAQDYDDFNLAHKQDGFHAVFNESVGPKPIEVEIKPEAAGAFFVKFRYGVSEGNSYRFHAKNNCWLLAEDPEAPSP